MFDITLYGHLVFDTIHDNGKTKMALGGMANMIRVFENYYPSINLGISPISIGTADIYIDRENSSRDSEANLNKYLYPPKILESKISHILYLNQLKNTSFIHELLGIVTADVCKGPKVQDSLPLLKYIDYLFLSDDEVTNLDIIVKNTKGSVIVHSPKGSQVYFDDKVYEFKVDESLMVKNANVLGAGDIFATCFLCSIYNSSTTESAIEYAHNMTSTLIGKYNEKV
jgi:hypothetical protein